MKHLRCAICDENWPNGKAYAICPTCGETTFEIDGMTGLTWKEGAERVQQHEESRRRHDAFDKYYAEREAERLHKELEPL